MFRLSYLICIFLIFTSPGSYAEEKSKTIIPLKLQCNISFMDFDGIGHAAKSVEIILTALKHKPGGMILVSQTDNYEFWVMTHGVQTINGQVFINNFQVAIKDKVSKLFMHALSDTSHTPGSPPKHARISLVDYYPDSSLEKGELLFECSHID